MAYDDMILETVHDSKQPSFSIQAYIMNHTRNIKKFLYVSRCLRTDRNGWTRPLTLTILREPLYSVHVCPGDQEGEAVSCSDWL